MSTRVAVVGAGIAGLAAALELAESADIDVTVIDASARPGGRIASSPFAGVDHVDEGADAFLARVPDAVDFARRVGLGDELVYPEPVGAAVWYDGLHPIPDGLLLGVPGRLRPLASSGLLSWRGKARAAIEPLLPRTSTEADSIGAFVRARFGDEVHERLVDSLVGSIYAIDTDNASLAAVPQLAALANAGRSVLLSARRLRVGPGTATGAASPIFAAPRRGVMSLVDATAGAVRAAGGTVVNGTTVESVTATDGGRWNIRPLDATFDAVILATPADAAARALVGTAPAAARLLDGADRADVVMVTLHVPAAEWPARLHGMSGYLVPKPVQRWVTAVSFGSQKWAHWRPPSGGEILRVSLGRDGVDVLHLTDGEVLEAVLTDLRHHLDTPITPLEVRITRWPGAFAQYRPHHADWVARVEAALPHGLFVTGAAYRGIGIPACVRDASATATRAATVARRLADSFP